MVIAALVFVFMIIAAISLYIYEKDKSQEGFSQKISIDMSKAIVLGKYIMGHPSIDLPINNTLVYREEEVLKLASNTVDANGDFNWLGKIPMDSITNISIEDASTLEKRVTLTRMALMGLFAFALQKKQTTNLAYLLIEWKQKWRETELSHETIFEYNMPQAAAIANISRNNLIRLIGD